MRSLSTTVGRACAIGGLGILMAGAAMALPAAEEPTIDSAGAGRGTIERPVDAPDVELPELADAAGEEAPVDKAADPVEDHPTPTTEAPGGTGDRGDRDRDPAVPTTTTMPDHLVIDDGEAMATTTTSTTTTAAPAPTTTTAPVASVAFSATQKYGSCGEDVPYDIFSGTAAPGSTVSISSPFGSGSATADADGTWSTKVEFPTAPTNETFAVDISGSGGSKTLHFTATGPADHDA